MYKLADALQAEGYTVAHGKMIPGGSYWRDCYAAWVKDCRSFVPILSPSFFASKACRDELRYADEKGRPILPVLGEPFGAEALADLSGCEMILGRCNRVPDQGWFDDDFSRNLEALIEAIRLHVPQPSGATRMAELQAVLAEELKQHEDTLAGTAEEKAEEKSLLPAPPVTSPATEDEGKLAEPTQQQASFGPRVPRRQPKWEKDSASKACAVCLGAWFTRPSLAKKHHCRCCGRVVCAQCAKNKQFEYASGSKARICRSCEAEYTQPRWVRWRPADLPEELARPPR
jgi:hypothetical protein